MKVWVQTKDFKVVKEGVSFEIGETVKYHDASGIRNKDLYKGKWQVLGVDKNGKLLLVSSENVTEYFFNQKGSLEGGMESYTNSIDKLDKICEAYGKGKGAVYGRCIRAEDINKITGFNESKYKNFGKKIRYKNELNKEFMWHDGKVWNSTDCEQTITLIKTDYLYKVKEDTQLSPITHKNIYNMLFGKDNKCYWLASKVIYPSQKTICFGIRNVCNGNVGYTSFVNSNGKAKAFCSGVRAVVALE